MNWTKNKLFFSRAESKTGGGLKSKFLLFPPQLLLYLLSFWGITVEPKASAYSLHLLDTTVGTLSGVVTCTVYDPNDSMSHSASWPSGTIGSLQTSGGIVTWTDAGSVHVTAYDPGDRTWHSFFWPSGAIGSLQTSSGIVTWTEAGSVHVTAYDPGDRTWHSFFWPSGAIGSLQTSSGIVAWMDAGSVHVTAYDPGDRTWHSLSWPSGAIGSLQTSSGIATWMDAGSVHVTAYDPGDRTWHSLSWPSGTIGSLQTSSGIVAWMDAGSVHVTAYDPGDRTWHSLSWPSGAISSLQISNGIVTWLDQGIKKSYFAARIPRAYFTADKPSGNVPLYVQFSDNSIGGITSYWWNFGDGGASSDRSPSHTFTTYGLYTVTFQVTGPGGSHSTTMTIKTDISAPTGSILINGGAQLTTTQAVLLSLVATDNSGTVSDMRLSNDGANWSSWESYASIKAWTLIGGYGTNIVYVQFSDLAGNISSIYSAAITLVENKAPMFTGSMTVASGKLVFSICGVAGQQFVLQSSTNLFAWTPIITNTLALNCTTVTNDMPAMSTSQFYRIMLLP